MPDPQTPEIRQLVLTMKLAIGEQTFVRKEVTRGDGGGKTVDWTEADGKTERYPTAREIQHLEMSYQAALGNPNRPRVRESTASASVPVRDAISAADRLAGFLVGVDADPLDRELRTEKLDQLNREFPSLHSRLVALAEAWTGYNLRSEPAPTD